MEGKRVGHFEIIEQIGEGGMGVVYKARDLNLNRLVALKALTGGVANSERRLRFIQEAHAASALSHPNIVTIHEIFRDDDRDFMAMELISGWTLADLPDSKRLRLTEVLRVAEQVAGALAAAHEAGIVHRDLKPSNVMVNAEGHVKVLDFGLAKLTEAAPPRGESEATLTAVRPHTEFGAIMGTVAYMSPEQAEGKPVDRRTDIFSFGSLLYELVGGRRAFEAATRVQTLAAVIEREPPPLDGQIPALPRELERLIGRCLKKNPGERPQSLLDIRHALEDIRAELSSGRFDSRPAPPPAPAAAPPGRKRRWWPIALAGGGILAAAGLMMTRHGGPPPHFQARPLTSLPGSETTPALSPDGRQVAFAWDGPEQKNTDIYIRNAGSGDPLRLTRHEARDISPAWSPNGETILFFRDQPGQPIAVIAVPSLGGTERKVCELGREIVGGGAGIKITFAPGGEWFVVTDDHALSLVRLGTGEKKKLGLGVEIKGHSHPLAPAISPDGTRIAFVVSDAGAGDSLYCGRLAPDFSIQSGSRLLVHTRFSGLSSTAWSKSGDAIFYTDSRLGPSRLYRVWADGGGGPAMPVPGLGDHILQPSTAADRLVYTHAYQDSNLWRISLAAAAGSDFKPETFLASTQDDWDAQFSADGTQVAFVSERAGDSDVWVAAYDGSRVRQLTNGASVRSPPMWSPDGTEILYSAFTDSGRGVYAVRVETGAVRQVGPPGAARPYWSRDGKSIYFTWGIGERYRTHRIVATGKGEATVAHPHEWSGLDLPLGETPDGSALLMETESDGVVKAPLDGSGPVPFLAPGPIRGGFLGKDVLFFRGSAPGSLMAYRFQDRRTVEVAKTGLSFRAYSISPEGRTLMYSQVDQRTRDLMIVEGIR